MTVTISAVQLKQRIWTHMKYLQNKYILDSHAYICPAFITFHIFHRPFGYKMSPRPLFSPRTHAHFPLDICHLCGSPANRTPLRYLLCGAENFFVFAICSFHFALCPYDQCHHFLQLYFRKATKSNIMI